MIAIFKATENDFKLLADIGRQTFLESHGESANKTDIDAYVNDKYSYPVVKEELADTNNIYHIAYFNNQPAGYSKIILNTPHPNIEQQNITKLERLYLLKEFYKQKAGLELFNFNVAIATTNKQAGIWLFVWKENERAINFYLKNGFEIIGSHNFKISATHSNPNHQMFLKF
ncbi:GNAT family N-acetyltransferase [Ferruginibacter sp.]|nr:GNAT family N-acetyltransferase [Ferruginibacter sp.]